MEITAPAVYEHEIAKSSDFQAGFESIIRNTAVLDRMLVSADTDYIIGGAAEPVAGSLAFRVGKMWGNGLALGLPVFNPEVSDPVTLSAPAGEDRIDTVQARAVLEEYDEQRRAFFNPETESGQYFTTPTKKRLKIECVALPGAEGQEAAPDAEAGWLKLAEILVSPGMTELQEENIRNVTAIYQGEENTDWTNQKARTFSLGSNLELKTMLAREHTAAGEHREKVIRAGNIDFGTGGNQVSAKKMPMGGNYAAGTDEFIATDSVFASIVKEASSRRSSVAALAQAIEGIVQTIADMVHEARFAQAIEGIVQTIADMVHEAPEDGAVYGRKNKGWIEVSGGGSGGSASLGDAIEALKLYSQKTLAVTNARIADRRKRGFDIGRPYLSPASRVYHFDTDLNDQNQETNIEIGHGGDAPALAGAEDTNGQVYFNPAVLAAPPYEMKGRSLYGHFSLETVPETFTKTFTAEAWIRLLYGGDAVILRMDGGAESVEFRVGERIVRDCEYSAAEEDGIEYSAAGTDGIEYSAAETAPGNIVIHEWMNGNGTETADLDKEMIAIPKRTWLHIAAVSTPEILAFYIGGKKIEFDKKTNSALKWSLALNPAKNEFNIDELLLDETAAVPFADFAENTEGRVPYAALDYREKWLVLEAQDPGKVKTNLFETEQFRAAVQAAINTQGV